MRITGLALIACFLAVTANAFPHAKRTSCQTDNDCPGTTCCNLNTLTCVNDPNGTICDIPPTKTTTKATTTKTTTKTTSTAAPTSCACTSGYSGLKNGGGPTGACCTSSDDCEDTCNSDGACGPSGATLTCKTTTATKTATKTTTSSTSVPTGPSGKTVVVNSNVLCFFLPPTEGEDIADSEKTAIAFCDSSSDAPGAKAFPSGFIQSAIYASGTGAGKYVQYTGLIDPSKYDLSSSDEGGQYDNHDSGSPPGSVCSGYPYFVNLVEPAEKDFCIRCCMSSSDCPTGRSEAGCQSIIPGDYSIVLSVSSPLTKSDSAAAPKALAASTNTTQVIWTAPTREEVASNATLAKALEKSVFPLGVGLDKPKKQ